MTVHRQRNKLNLPLIFSIISFVVGYGINALMNYASYTNKVDQLTATVVEIRDDLKERRTIATDFRQKTNSRLTALEVKVFGQPQQISQQQISKLRQQMRQTSFVSPTSFKFYTSIIEQ